MPIIKLLKPNDAESARIIKEIRKANPDLRHASNRDIRRIANRAIRENGRPVGEAANEPKRAKPTLVEPPC